LHSSNDVHVVPALVTRVTCSRMAGPSVLPAASAVQGEDGGAVIGLAAVDERVLSVGSAMRSLNASSPAAPTTFMPSTTAGSFGSTSSMKVGVNTPSPP
jgi:hypothetical protein